MNLLDILFIGFTFTGIIIGFYLLLSNLNPVKMGSQLVFKIWIFAISTNLLFFIFNLNNLFPNIIGFYFLAYPLPLLHIALFYLLVLQLTTLSKITFKKIFLHAIPYGIFVSYLFYLYLNDSYQLDVKNGFLAFSENVPELFKNHNGSFFAISATVYIILVLKTVKNYRSKLVNNFSNLENIELKWITHLAYFSILLFGGMTVLSILGANLFADSFPLFKYISIYTSIFLVFFALRFQKQKELLWKSDLNKSDVLNIKSKSHSSKPKKELSELAEKLVKHLEERNSYLNENLTLSSLANELETSPQLLSQTINIQLNITFYQLINGYRIEKAKLLLVDSNLAHLSILGIAMECGFKSKSTFYKIFRANTGKTPSEFKKMK